MKKGQSYIRVTDSNKNHPLIKLLLKKGCSDIELLYASSFSPDCGWTLDCKRSNGDCFNDWLGYTIKSSLKIIENNF